jgi:hypothetical protein
MESMKATPWVKANRSAEQGACVEQRRCDGVVEVRDTKDHGVGPVLRFTPAEFAAWLDGAKKGEFDHLIAP